MEEQPTKAAAHHQRFEAGGKNLFNKLITDPKYKDILYGIKLCYKNIGFNGKFYTLPYFVTFLLKRWINERIEKQK